MNEANRAYNIIRGYFNQELDRIRGVERGMADQELAELYNYQPKTVANSSAPQNQEYADQSEEEKALARDRRARELLGVTAEATFEHIRSTFDRLAERCDPTKFPEGSKEQAEVFEINRKLYWAYQVLTEKMDVTEKRFKSLELD